MYLAVSVMGIDYISMTGGLIDSIIPLYRASLAR